MTGGPAADVLVAPERRTRPDRRFTTFWISQTLSMAGSQVSYLAIPLAAVLILDANALQTGTLTAASRLPFLVFGLLAGVWVDRLRRRPVLIWTAAARAAVLLWIPVAVALDGLTIEHVYVVAFAIGSLALLSDIAAQSLLPALATPERLLEANSRLEVSRASTDMVGPSAGGALVQLITAPLAILADVGCYLLAAALMLGVRVREEKPAAPVGRTSVWRQLREGLAFVLGNRLLRWNAIASAVSNLFTNALLAIVVLYLVRTLRLSPGIIGLLLGISGVGALLGATCGGPLTRRYGLGRALLVSTGVTGVGAVLLGLASGSYPMRLAWVCLAYLTFSFGYPAFNVAVISLRQALAPDHLLGRTNATMRFLAWGTMPIGAFAGGVLGSWMGLRTTMVVAGLGLLLPPLILAVSPLRGIRTAGPVTAGVSP
jgi:MFS family permease